VTNALNTPSVSAEEAPRLKPYMDLATKLGLLAGQLTKDSIQRVSIEAEGTLAELNMKPVTAAVLAGMLRPISDTVNMVNAPYLARERDIDVAEVRHDREGDYASLLRVTVETAGGTRTVAGTLFGDKAPRLVDLAGIRMEAELTGGMLYIENDDKPGFIGAVGTALGEAGVNIGTFTLGRHEDTDDAIMLVAVDDEITEPLLWKICQLDGVRDVKALRF
ncbi:MAG: ACT domain-containing protein, partial [Pseudomonadota bacterium]